MQTDDVTSDPVSEPEIPLDAPDHDTPVEQVEHRARCVECGVTVSYVASVTGHGFALFGGGDDSYGVGPNGRPTCPNGHGEMEIADDAIPVADAIDEVTKLQQAQQGDLPGIMPPFNYQGAYLELESKAVEVDELHHEYVNAAEEARDAKKLWDKAAELYTKMALEFQRRRQEKVSVGEPVDALDCLRCTFEQAHPDETCPICGGIAESSLVEGDYAPRDASLHADQAAALLVSRDAEDLIESLEVACEMSVPAVTVCGWTPEERAEVRAYVDAADTDADSRPARPTCLGTMHVAGHPADGAQTCTQCDAPLIVWAEGGTEYYAVGWLVGTDCPGRAPEPARYPKRSKAVTSKVPSCIHGNPTARPCAECDQETGTAPAPKAKAAKKGGKKR